MGFSLPAPQETTLTKKIKLCWNISVRFLPSAEVPPALRSSRQQCLPWEDAHSLWPCIAPQGVFPQPPGWLHSWTRVCAGPMRWPGVTRGCWEDPSCPWPELQTAWPPTSKGNSSRKSKQDLSGCRAARQGSACNPIIWLMRTKACEPVPSQRSRLTLSRRGQFNSS